MSEIKTGIRWLGGGRNKTGADPGRNLRNLPPRKKTGRPVEKKLERIQAAADTGLITTRDADDLIHALKFIADIRLKHQARQLEAGQTPDHLVDPDELSGLHRRYLRSAFGIVSEAQKALALRYLL